MKKIILIVLSALAIFSIAYAKEDTASLLLRAEPNQKAPIVSKLKTDTILIPIYQKGDWIKVGNPDDGQVGWMENKIYQKMDSTPIVQSVVMSLFSKPDQKGSTQVVVYQNGRRLSDQEAKQLVSQMYKEQRALDEYFKAIQASMEKMLNQSTNWLKNFEMPKLDWPFKQPSAEVGNTSKS